MKHPTEKIYHVQLVTSCIEVNHLTKLRTTNITTVVREVVTSLANQSAIGYNNDDDNIHKKKHIDY
jgi:hypothetical protein